MPRGLLAASADLGATGWQTFRLVVLPLSLPGTIVGGLFAFVLAMGDFVTPQMVGGTPASPTAAWCKASSAWPSTGRSAPRLAVILLAGALTVIALAGWVQSRSRV